MPLFTPQRGFQRSSWRVAAGLACLLAAASLNTSIATAAIRTAAPSLPQVQHRIEGMAVPFEANAGQFAPEVAFSARTFAGTLFVTRDGSIVHALAGRPIDNAPRIATVPGKAATAPRREPGWALVEKLQGALPLAPSGLQGRAAQVSRIEGPDPTHWQKDITTFGTVDLGQAWPGIGVSLAARGSNVEKLFTVAPGADPRRIQLSIGGAAGLRLAADGALIAATGHGDVAFTAPVAFQHIAGNRVEVPVHYALLADRSGYRFQLGDYDHTRPLVIDPLLQATYLGGGALEYANAVALDAAGNVLVAGYTESTPFPGTTGGIQPASGGGRDGYVTKLSGDLTSVLRTTYLGGSGSDEINSMRLDAAGNIYVAGTTTSSNFPGTAGALQTANAGGGDGFVARLSGDLATLQQATYLGGGSIDIITATRFDAAGNLLVAGFTQSGDLPGRTGGARPNAAGGYDAFISRMTPDLKTLLQSTYYGGSGLDFASALVIDGNGKVLIAGTHNSTNLPMPGGGAQLTNGGTYDGYVARFSANLTTLEQATYFGGNLDENTAAMALDSAGHVFIAGYTESSNLAAGGSAQSAIGGSVDVFVARLSADLSAVQKVTYYGGSGFDLASAMVVDAAGSVIVTGVEESANMPGTAGGYQPVYGGGGDAFIARFNNDLTVLAQATYFGGGGRDEIPAILIDGGGNYIVAGTTASNTLTGTTGGAQPAYSGGTRDAFVARFTASLLANPVVTASAGLHGSVSPASQTVVPGQSATVTVTPDAGYAANVTGCGGSLAGSVYTTAAINANCAVTASFLLTQTITTGPLPVVPTFAAGTSFALAAPTSTSGLPVTYGSTTPAVCSVAGSTVTMLAAGTCTVVATQAGNGAYAATSSALNFALVTAVGVPALSVQGLAMLSLLLGSAAWLRRRRPGRG